MHVSRLDVIYRKLLLTKFFTKGWGYPEHLQRLFDFRKVVANRELCYKLVPKNHPITILNKVTRSDCRIIEGKFRSPFAIHLPGIVSEEVQDSYFQMILPLKLNEDKYKPMCIHLAGTGDHYFWRRRNIMAKPLLKAGIGAIILENPYYGVRKPKKQLRSSLHFVSDIFVMGGSLIFECLVLLNWCESLGFGPLGVTGISMGGHMASLVASSWPKPIVLVPCLSWSTASSVFTEGVMSDCIDWDMLQDQFLSNKFYCNSLSKMVKIVDDPFKWNPGKELDVAFYNIPEKKQPSKYTQPSTHKKSSRTEVSYNKNKQSKEILTKETPLKGLKKTPVLKLKGKNAPGIKERDKEALWFMRGLMDEFTHLKNFSVPCDTSLIISISAQSDGYVPRDGISKLDDIWLGTTVRYVKSGHVGAYIFCRKIFRQSIIEAFDRAKKKYPPPSPATIEI